MRQSRAVLTIAVLGLSVMSTHAKAQTSGSGGGGGTCGGSSSTPPMCMMGSMSSMNMSGMPKDSATMAQMQLMHQMVMNHEHIVRSVTYLPDGVRTTTESDDPKLAKIIQEHVSSMELRVGKGDDPQLPMETPALHAIFAGGKSKIRTVTQLTPTGIIVEQTSPDKTVAEALQKHAAELSDLVDRGMQAMHETMMKNMPATVKKNSP